MSFSNDPELEKASHETATHVEDSSWPSSELIQRGAMLIEEERHLSLWTSAKLHRRALLISEYLHVQPSH